MRQSRAILRLVVSDTPRYHPDVASCSVPLSWTPKKELRAACREQADEPCIHTASQLSHCLYELHANNICPVLATIESASIRKGRSPAYALLTSTSLRTRSTASKLYCILLVAELRTICMMLRASRLQAIYLPKLRSPLHRDPMLLLRSQMHRPKGAQLSIHGRHLHMAEKLSSPGPNRCRCHLY